MENCPFCKIVNRRLPADIVYENDRVLVFRDIHPAAPVHLLVVPKIHIQTLSDCTGVHAGLLGEMMALIPSLADQQRIGVVGSTAETRVGGYRIIINTGPDGGQEVYHLHIHLIGGPRPWKYKN
ncbi:MAG: histidine triad nucleotide-binding protein [Burkholderiaceae bacterium]|jgi:histidine triad (HIT) family protein|nr:histidine triad nucleotide-binding protein [Burkholderiaceae bacterium]